MLKETLTDLVETGSTTLVAAMATDAWQHSEAGAATLFARGRPIRQERMEARLQRSAVLIALADDSDDVRRKLIPTWRLELEALLRRHPDAEEELRSLVEWVHEALPPAQRAWVQAILTRD